MLALGWVTIQGLDVDAVATNTVKSQKRRNGGPLHYILQGNNKKFMYDRVRIQPDPDHCGGQDTDLRRMAECLLRKEATLLAADPPTSSQLSRNSTNRSIAP